LKKKSKAVQHLSYIKRDDEYATPDDIYKDGCKKYKIKPKLDVSGSRKHHKVKRYFSKNKNALEQDWKVDFWMNPPYSQVGKFMKKAYEEHKKWNVNGIILVYSKTDTKWFNRYVYNQKKNKWLAEFYPIEGRIKFWKNGKKTEFPAPYPSCFIIYRKSKRRRK
jgi:phage N-6-adenine-methyltransferase